MANATLTPQMQTTWSEETTNRTQGSNAITAEPLASTDSAFHQTQQVVGTSHELVSAGDLTDDVWVEVENTDETNYVEYGVEVAAAFHAFGKIPPKMRVVLGIASSLAGSYLQANTATCKCIISLYKIAS